MGRAALRLKNRRSQKVFGASIGPRKNKTVPVTQISRCVGVALLDERVVNVARVAGDFEAGRLHHLSEDGLPFVTITRLRLLAGEFASPSANGLGK